MRIARGLLALLAIGLVAGCDDPILEGPTGSVIVGLTSDLRAGVDLSRIHVTMLAGVETLRDEELVASTGRFHVPMELAFRDRPAGELLTLRVEAFTASSATPLLTREASTRVLPGRTLLFRVGLDAACVVHPAPDNPPFCADATTTCIAGVCRDPFVDPAALEPYASDWATAAPDVCKPAGAGAPIVLVGQGQADYLPLDDGEVVQVEAGPQGGHHIWVASRMKNLHRSGSITTLSGSVPDLGLDLLPFSVIFTFDTDEGGYCKLSGLRFQIDQDRDVQDLLGHQVKVHMNIADRDGTVGEGDKTVTLSDDVL